MSGQADEFCLVEPLALSSGDLIESSAPAPAPDTPAPPPVADTPTNASANTNSSSSSSAGGANNTAVPSVLADDELWGPPAGARRPYQATARGAGGGGTAAMTPAAASHRVISPPWPQTSDEFCAVGDGAGGGRRVEGGTAGGGDGSMKEAPSGGGVAGVGLERAGATAAIGGRTPRRKRSSTSGINRERQFDGTSIGGSGSRLGGGGSGRRRSGPGNGRGGLSKKTLNIVTNLKSHTTDVRTREEMEDLEEEKRLAEEERRFKENLRQKGDDFDHTIRILLLGDSGVGKTSLMTRFSEDKFAPTMISTAGVDFKVQTLDIQGKRVRCQIWDTAGQERFHVITRAYYRGAHGIALAYDVTDDDSFKNVNYWMANIQTHADRGHRMQKMILGNKVDIEERRISTKEGQEVAKEFGVPFFEVSAKNGFGVSDAFYSLAVDIVQAMEAANRRGADDRRGASKLFGGGAARLRSFASSKKPAFMTGRKMGGVSWTVGTSTTMTTPGGQGATPNGKQEVMGGGESGEEGAESEKGASAITQAGEGTREAAEAESGSGGGGGGGATAMAKSASERCKVS